MLFWAFPSVGLSLQSFCKGTEKVSVLSLTLVLCEIYRTQIDRIVTNFLIFVNELNQCYQRSI